MEQLKWCLKQPKGIKLIHPNKNLSDSYLKRAKLDQENIERQNPIWKVIISYYACYNALSALLIRYGIKSEIHSCSILLTQHYERLKRFTDFLEGLKENRINTQYYLKKPKPPNLETINEFINMCELEIIECNQKRIEKIKEHLFK
ncbi:HEPN domain-containing protein [Candidatus Woesearchaeota archaeon]|nr:HEPN domain-containing protein [Candidatus Woesearchaeota archaeon]